MTDKTRVTHIENSFGGYDVVVYTRGLPSPLFYTMEEAHNLRNQLGSTIRQIHREEERDEENSG